MREDIYVREGVREEVGYRDAPASKQNERSSNTNILHMCQAMEDHAAAVVTARTQDVRDG